MNVLCAQSAIMGLALLSTACGAQDAKFSAENQTTAAKKPGVEEVTSGKKLPDQKLQEPDAAPREEPLLVTERFAFGSTRGLRSTTDLLFVIDNSYSMDSSAPKVAQAFADIAAKFPKDARIGVLSTQATDPATGTPLQGAGFGSVVTPGFGNLVSAESAAEAATVDSVIKGAAPCADRWFAPGDKNEAGLACEVAATKALFFNKPRGGCEAGGLALQQFVDQTPAADLFRPGADVIVVFVTDEYDGCGDEADRFPTSDKLREKIAKKVGIASLSVSGFVNLKNQPYYAPLASETSGVLVDIGEIGGSSVAESLGAAEIIDNEVGASERTVVLEHEAAAVLEVKVGGKVTNDYIVSDNRVISLLQQVQLTAGVEIVVVYEKQH